MAVKQVEVPSTADDRRKAEIVDFVKTLRSERETLRDLAHPNIVEYLGFEENPQNVNMWVMLFQSHWNILSSQLDFSNTSPEGPSVDV